MHARSALLWMHACMHALLCIACMHARTLCSALHACMHARTYARSRACSHACTYVTHDTAAQRGAPRRAAPHRTVLCSTVHGNAFSPWHLLRDVQATLALQNLAAWVGDELYGTCRMLGVSSGSSRSTATGDVTLWPPPKRSGTTATEIDVRMRGLRVKNTKATSIASLSYTRFLACITRLFSVRLL